MNLKSFQKIPIGEIKYFESIGSTNDEALVWATHNAPNLSIVIADEQTSGRGRLNRPWFTPKGTALAFSLILHPDKITHLSRTVGLAALSIADSCSKLGLAPEIKWPNDILLNGKKVAGILIETVWNGDKADSVVIGMGINVSKESVPPIEHLKFPATSIETEIGIFIKREDFLQDILSNIVLQLPKIETDDFMASWENYLAYKNQNVQIIKGSNETTFGKLLGLETDGGLRLQTENGKELTIHYGDVSLRPTT